MLVYAAVLYLGEASQMAFSAFPPFDVVGSSGVKSSCKRGKVERLRTLVQLALELELGHKGLGVGLDVGHCRGSGVVWLCVVVVRILKLFIRAIWNVYMGTSKWCFFWWELVEAKVV